MIFLGKNLAARFLPQFLSGKMRDSRAETPVKNSEHRNFFEVHYVIFGNLVGGVAPPHIMYRTSWFYVLCFMFEHIS